jgi:vacuolar protein sorting-associated protein 13A/C
LNKNYGGDIPKTDVTMLFDELAFGLDDHQYRDAILMIDLFHANLKKQKVNTKANLHGNNRKLTETTQL